MDTESTDLAQQQMDHSVRMQRAELALRAYAMQLTPIWADLEDAPVITSEEVRQVVMTALGFQKAAEG